MANLIQDMFSIETVSPPLYCSMYVLHTCAYAFYVHVNVHVCAGVRVWVKWCVFPGVSFLLVYYAEL